MWPEEFFSFSDVRVGHTTISRAAAGVEPVKPAAQPGCDRQAAPATQEGLMSADASNVPSSSNPRPTARGGASSRAARRPAAVPGARQRARVNGGAAPDQSGTGARSGAGRYRNWCWTLKIPEDIDDDAVLGSELVRTLLVQLGAGLDYLCFGVERGGDGYRHLQGYAEFPSALRLPQVKRVLGHPSIHVEGRQGSQQQAVDYTKGDYTNSAGVYKPLNAIWAEYGTRHVDPSSGKSKEVNDIYARLKAGAAYTPALVEECQLRGTQFFQYHKAFAAAEQFFAKQREAPPEVHVRWGDAGTGKTRHAVDNGAAILGWRTPFMLGYKGTEEVVCIDDFNPHDMPRSVFLQLTDRYKCSVEVKGAVLPWNPRVIYITSNFDPAGWYSTGSWDDAVRRRLTSVTNCTV